MKAIKKIIFAIGIILIGITLIVLIRTFNFKSKQINVTKVDHVRINENSAVEHLSGGIRIKTVSYDDPSKNDYHNFVVLKDYIDAQYPLIHNNLTRTVINNYALLYKWDGANPAQKPVILTAHMDVVPADAKEWRFDPFSGSIKNGFILGRGTLDDKGSLFSILEAVEYLLQSGFKPDRTIYIGFGYDEEAGTLAGLKGARKIAEYLKNTGVHAEFLLDEGGIIVDKNISVVKGQKFALIGVAEKGFLTLKITAAAPGGHAMMPPKDLAIVRLAKAITDLDKNKFRASLNGTTGLSFDYFGPEMPFFQKMVFANRWLFSNLIISQLEKIDFTAAMMHTTIAPTIIQGGIKEQSLPTSASVLVNFRTMPGETSQDVINYVKKYIADPRIQVERYDNIIHEPTLMSGLNDQGYQILNRTIREVFPDVMVAPVLETGSTDSRHYKEVADDLYRFAPYFYYSMADSKRPHGSDEQIRIDNYLEMIQFYIRYIENSAGSMKKS